MSSRAQDGAGGSAAPGAGAGPGAGTRSSASAGPAPAGPPRALITGAASGLGRALARRYAADGWRVLLTDVDGVTLERTAAGIPGGERIAHRPLDVRSAADWEGARGWCEREWGGLDLLFNNAGVAGAGRFERIPLEDWDWIIDINLKGAIRGCRAFVPLFQRQGSGQIVNTASAAGLLNPPAMASYDVTKAGVVSLSEVLRHELGPQGIRVSVVCPTFFRTNLTRSLRTPDPELARITAKLVDQSSTSADEIAAEIAHRVAKGRFLVLPDRSGRMAHAIKRLAPFVYTRGAQRATRRLLARIERSEARDA